MPRPVLIDDKDRNLGERRGFPKVVIRMQTKRETLPTWFLSGLLVAQLPQVIAAAGVYGPILQQESCVSAATAHVRHFFPMKEFTFPRLNHYLPVNPAQA